MTWLLIGSVIVIAVVLAFAFSAIAQNQRRAGELAQQTQEETKRAAFIIEEYNRRIEEAKMLSEIATDGWEQANQNYNTGAYQEAIELFRRTQGAFIQSAEKYRQTLEVNNGLIETDFVKQRPKLASYLELRSLWLDAQVERHLAMHEAAERMEAAVGSLANGQHEIYRQSLDRANEQVRLHDLWVKIANTILSKMNAISIDIPEIQRPT